MSRLGVLGLICILVLAVYSGTFSASFHYDDYHQIVKNPNVRSLANIPGFFVRGDTSSYEPALRGYRPLTLASFALNYAVSGYRTWSYHLFNIIIHILNAFLVFAITSSIFLRASSDDKEAGLLPLASALIFALHPLQTSAVTYISGRSALLSCLFTLLGFYFFLNYRPASGGRRLAFLSASVVAFCLGLLSKETAMALIGIMLAYDLTLTVPRRERIESPLALAPGYVPFIAVLALYLAVYKHFHGTVMGGDADFGVWRYLVSESKVLFMYLRLLILPVNQNADYALPLSGFDLWAALSFAGIAAALFLLIRFGRGRPAAFFGLWFFAAWAPESTLVPIRDLAVEYRMYMPSIGFIAFATAAAAVLIRRKSVRKWAAVAVMAALGVLSFDRNEVWSTELSLWQDVANKSPLSARAHHNLGVALLSQGRYPEAEKELEKALAVGPDYKDKDSVYMNLGLCLLELGQKEEALMLFQSAVQMNPGNQEAYCNLGQEYYRLGRYEESAEAYQKAIKINPGLAEAHSDLAQTYMALGRRDDALREASEGLRYKPGDFAMSYNLTAAYYNAGMLDRALEQARITYGLAGDEKERNGAASMMDNILKEQGKRHGDG